MCTREVSRQRYLRPDEHTDGHPRLELCQRAQAAAQPGAVPAGLDGMRALAVVAVMLYHANHTWLSGGFLGVEVFFVISGYLITLLLIGEHERNGRVELGSSGCAAPGACCRPCSR